MFGNETPVDPKYIYLAVAAVVAVVVTLVFVYPFAMGLVNDFISGTGALA